MAMRMYPSEGQSQLDGVDAASFRKENSPLLWLLCNVLGPCFHLSFPSLSVTSAREYL